MIRLKTTWVNLASLCVVVMIFLSCSYLYGVRREIEVKCSCRIDPEPVLTRDAFSRTNIGNAELESSTEVFKRTGILAKQTGNTEIKHEFHNQKINVDKMFSGRISKMRRECMEKEDAYGLDLYAIFKLPRSMRPYFYISDKYKLLICHIPKCGSTTWKKALLVMEGMKSLQEALNLRESATHRSSVSLNLWNYYNESNASSILNTMYRITNYTRVITVREPLERLVSAYKDKMLPTTPLEGYRAFSKRIHRLYSDRNITGGSHRHDDNSYASWKEVVRYLLDKKRRNERVNEHWQFYTKICSPCNSAYHYVAKLETMRNDAELLSRMIGFDITPFFPDRGIHEKWSNEYREYFEELSKDDREELYEMYKEQYDMFGYVKPEYL